MAGHAGARSLEPAVASPSGLVLFGAPAVVGVFVSAMFSVLGGLLVLA